MSDFFDVATNRHNMTLLLTDYDRNHDYNHDHDHDEKDDLDDDDDLDPKRDRDWDHFLTRISHKYRPIKRLLSFLSRPEL